MTTEQDDVAVHAIGSIEARGSLGPVAAGGRVQVEGGVSYTTEHREATITNTGQPDNRAEEIGDTTVVAIEGVGYLDGKVGAANQGPAGANREAGTLAYDVYEANTTQRTDYVGDREVGKLDQRDHRLLGAWHRLGLQR